MKSAAHAGLRKGWQRSRAGPAVSNYVITHLWREGRAVLVNLQVLHHLGKELRVAVAPAVIDQTKGQRRQHRGEPEAAVLLF